MRSDNGGSKETPGETSETSGQIERSFLVGNLRSTHDNHTS
jgi:hypothetical protein